jgi:hypothetical protein
MEVKYEVTIAQLPNNIVAMVLTNEIKSMSQLKEMGKEISNMLHDVTPCLTSGMHGIKAFLKFSFCSKMHKLKACFLAIKCVTKLWDGIRMSY